jgi:proline dehydrogenase
VRHAPGSATSLEPSVQTLGSDLASRMRPRGRTPATTIERRPMRALADEPELRAALFRFVDSFLSAHARGQHIATLLEAP